MTSDACVWSTAPTDITLSPGDVHIWRINLERSPSDLQILQATLSSDEKAKAERFYFQQHRQRYIAGRGILRAILSRYLHVEPQAIQFNYEPRGKPVLAETFARTGVSFNLSHSHSLALCAVTNNRLIGVDVEYIRSVTDITNLSQRFFSPREDAVVRSLPPQEQQKVFFRYWTCKEAYLKATGEGITQLEQVEVFLSPKEPARLNHQQWSLIELVPASNYVAAAAVAGTNINLQCWEYE